MTYEIITKEDLQKFRLQLLEDLTRLLSGAVQPQTNKEWLRSSEVRKLLGISHGTLQNLRIKNILPHRKGSRTDPKLRGAPGIFKMSLVS